MNKWRKVFSNSNIYVLAGRIMHTLSNCYGMSDQTRDNTRQSILIGRTIHLRAKIAAIAFVICGAKREIKFRPPSIMQQWNFANGIGEITFDWHVIDVVRNAFGSCENN